MPLIPFTKDELQGMNTYSELVRNEISGSYSPLGPMQRAELVRLCAQAFGVQTRIPYLWFTKGVEQRQMLRRNLPKDDLRARIILAKCLVAEPQADTARREWLRAAPSDGSNSNAFTLNEMLYGPYINNEIYHWELNGYAFNIYNRTETQEKIAFFLQWDYEYVSVPAWVPQPLRPYGGIDPNPFLPA